jgi:hypothetical protein
VCKISARPNVSTISRCFKASSATILGFTANTARMWWLDVHQKCYLWFLFMHQRSLSHNEISQRLVRFSTVDKFSIPTLDHVLIMVLNLAVFTETSTFIISP